jgi:hypothetical protein
MERAIRLMLFLDRTNNKHGPGFMMLGVVVDIRLLKQLMVGLASMAGGLGGTLINIQVDSGQIDLGLKSFIGMNNSTLAGLRDTV